jgi:hypothetical protein
VVADSVVGSPLWVRTGHLAPCRNIIANARDGFVFEFACAKNKYLKSIWEIRLLNKDPFSQGSRA